MASATAVWHQVKEEVMEIHSKLERRIQLDKQVHPINSLHIILVCKVGLNRSWPPHAEGQDPQPKGQQLGHGCSAFSRLTGLKACRARRQILLCLSGSKP